MLLAIAEKYGGKRKFLSWAIDTCKWKYGRYSKAQEIDWPRVKRVIFVCKGNICRSAYAHAYASATKLGKKITIDSCGVSTTTGKPANPDATRIAAERGLDLSDHMTQSYDRIEFDQHDLIFFMEPSHKIALNQKAGKIQSQQSFLALWANHTAYLQDPYGTSDSVFRHCFHIIEQAIDNLEKHAKQYSLVSLSTSGTSGQL